MEEEKDDIEEKLIKWLNNELHAEELEELQNDPAFNTYRQIADESATWKVPALNIDQSYDKLRTSQTKVVRVNWYQSSLFKIAASVLVIFSLALYLIIRDTDTVTYTTSLAESKDIRLPDSSYVFLGPNSSLRYDNSSYKETRSIEMSGVAFFDVNKGKQFIVKFDEGQVEVLGTSFEIRSGTHASVACYEGRVRVSNADNENVIRAGEEVKLKADGTLNKLEFPLRKWSKELVRFNSAPLSQVFESLKNDYDIQLTITNIDLDRKFTGAYVKNDLERALKMVCVPMNITYEIDGKSVVLR